MKRGEVWTVAGSGFASKPRPAIIVQSDALGELDSTLLCLITSNSTVSASTRVLLEPDSNNGLINECYVMADKVVAVKKSSLGVRIGRLSDKDVQRVGSALRLALGL